MTAIIKFRWIWLIGILCLLASLRTRIQTSTYPIVGEVCPDFRLTDVEHASFTTLTRDYFKGRYVILDFWNRYCGICLESMPKMDSIYRKHRDSVSVLLVGYTGKRYSGRSDHVLIRKLFEQTRREEKLILPIAYDSLLFHRFNIGACPYLIVLDRKSKVMAITTSISNTQLEDLMRGKQANFRKAYRRDEIVEKVKRGP